jgi:hypothetical protein
MIGAEQLLAHSERLFVIVFCSSVVFEALMNRAQLPESVRNKFGVRPPLRPVDLKRPLKEWFRGCEVTRGHVNSRKCVERSREPWIIAVQSFLKGINGAFRNRSGGSIIAESE